ncbi:MAG: tetratricopeptide repeat protein [Candidatus Zixiibacteriota bacterium]|nr:MAG: tetratricopeptide repeat protein [candidate division Zixibacteria bacterium]
MIETASLTERIEQCERILKENSKSQVFAALADAHRLNGDLDQAFRVCRQGIRTHPDYGAGHLVMAKISLGRKMYDWAEQELNKAVELDGETRLTEQLRVEILIAKGSIGEAESAIKRLRASSANRLLLQDLQQRLERQKKELKRRQVEPFPGARRTAPNTEMDTTRVVVRPKTPLTLDQVLDQLLKLPSVESIVCAYSDGTVVDHRGDPEDDIPAIAAFGIEMCRNAETETAVDVFGETRQIAVETEKRIIVIMKFSRYNLVLYCEKGINVGALRLKLDEVTENLQDGQGSEK